MKLFTIDEHGRFVQFKEKDFETDNREIDLENLLEVNPEYFFDNTKILIIGRQVTTNLNKSIDLLGVDQLGNTVLIELKRGQTPRETLAQLIEYASFIDNLDYDQLNEIFQNYSSEDVSLEDYHKEYYKFENSQEEVSWNKNTKLVIVASSITPDIKQAALYLRKKGFDVFCLEFKYFVDQADNKMISSDFVVGDENFIRQKVSSSTQLPKTTKEEFLSNLDNNGRRVFTRIFEFIDEQNLLIRWGSKGFSANVKNKSEFVGVFFGWPINAPWGQAIATGFGQIEKKIDSSQSINHFYRTEIKKLNLFDERVFFFRHEELRWSIKPVDDNKLDELIKVFGKVVQLVKVELIKDADS